MLVIFFFYENVERVSMAMFQVDRRWGKEKRKKERNAERNTERKKLSPLKRLCVP